MNTIISMLAFILIAGVVLILFKVLSSNKAVKEVLFQGEIIETLGSVESSTGKLSVHAIEDNKNGLIGLEFAQATRLTPIVLTKEEAILIQGGISAAIKEIN